jgi:hypothetical protein
MLERGEGTAPEKEKDQLLMSLSGEINTATRFVHPDYLRVLAHTDTPCQLPPHDPESPHNKPPTPRSSSAHQRPHALHHWPPPLCAHLPDLRVTMGRPLARLQSPGPFERPHARLRTNIAPAILSPRQSLRLAFAVHNYPWCTDPAIAPGPCFSTDGQA